MRSTARLAGLRVCFVAGTLGQGGAERQLFYMTKALVAAGAQPTVLSLTEGEFWEERLRNAGARVVYAGANPRRAARAAAVARALRACRPAVVQSVHFYTNLYAALAGRATGVRDIGSMRGDGSLEMRNHGRLLGRMSLRMPRMLAVNSNAAESMARRSGLRADRVHLLRNAVDTDLFRPAAPETQCDIDVLGVGRLGGEKRFDRFLRVLALANRGRVRKLRAAIAGEGPLRGALEQQARETGLAEATTFLGAWGDMAGLYARAKILLISSDHEGTPNAALEAMACGKPVAATDAGDLRHIVAPECGVVAGEGEEERLAAFLREATDDAELRGRLGGNARSHMVRNYSVELLPERLGELYDAALA